jgi:hypothetical protein
MTPSEIENTTWAKRFMDKCISDYNQAIEFACRKPLQVRIYHNKETRQWLWSIAPYIDGNQIDFWMASFKTEKEATDLCERMGWEILED